MRRTLMKLCALIAVIFINEGELPLPILFCQVVRGYVSFSACCDIINIDLSNYDPANKTARLFSTLHKLQETASEINLQNINPDVGFFVIQVHSFKHDVVLSSSEVPSGYTSVNGSNIGLVDVYDAKLHNLGSSSRYYLYKNEMVPFNIMIAVTLYDINGK